MAMLNNQMVLVICLIFCHKLPAWSRGLFHAGAGLVVPGRRIETPDSCGQWRMLTPGPATSTSEGKCTDAWPVSPVITSAYR